MYIKAIMPVCRHLIDKARLLFVDSLSLQACYRRVMASDVKCTAEDYVVDMRSDVLTKPTPRMLQAMTQASLDDDVFREDRTTFELEAKMADLFGKEAGLFVPSGTMANLIAVGCHCSSRGLELLLGDKSHIFMFEQGGISQFFGLHPRPLKNLPDGTFDIDELESCVRPLNDPHQPLTGLIAVENTHNYCGGKIISSEFLSKVRAVAQRHHIPIHMDGSRLLNASVGLGLSVKELGKDVDSISFCFSKGVGAPIGSVLLGSKELIAKALRVRKGLGGGWRKSGPLAAAALVAMEDAAERFQKDHEHAKTFAKAIKESGQGIVDVDVDGVHTNIVMVKVVKSGLTAAEFCSRLAQVTNSSSSSSSGVAVKMMPFDAVNVRCIMHSSLTSDHVERAVEKTQLVLQQLRD